MVDYPETTYPTKGNIPGAGGVGGNVGYKDSDMYVPIIVVRCIFIEVINKSKKILLSVFGGGIGPMGAHAPGLVTGIEVVDIFCIAPIAGVIGGIGAANEAPTQ